MNAAVLMFSACLAGADAAPPAAQAPVVASTGTACVGNCGHAVVSDCGGCDSCGPKHGILAKLKARLGHTCDAAPACPAPAPVCKPACKPEPVCKAAPACDTCGSKNGWEPGYFLHMLCHSHTASACTNGCATAAAPVGCGSVVIPPTTAPATPPKVEPKKETGPEPKKIPTKIGALPASRPILTPVAAPVKLQDLAPIPF